jgi:hypothetical protein
MSKNAQITRSPAARDTAELAARENDYRRGWTDRREGMDRGYNPFTVEGFIRYGLMPNAAEEEAPRHQASKMAWYRGWDTAEATAAAEGEATLKDIPLWAEPAKAPTPPHKVKDQLPLDLGLPALPARKGRAA